MVASIPLGLIAFCSLLPAAFAQFNWGIFTNAAAPQTGKVSFRRHHTRDYGQLHDLRLQPPCTLHLAWLQGLRS